MSIQVNLTIKEVYKELCPECQKRVEKLVQEKITQDLAKRVLEDKEER